MKAVVHLCSTEYYCRHILHS